jgi:ribosomal protein S18 acetylase RimI-like enzyme
MHITLRPTTSEDIDFLLQVYASVREEELARVDWDEAQKRAFVQMQFAAQHAAYTENYPGAEFQIILVDGVAAGRLYLHRRPDEIRIMDIALLPAYRDQGIGSSLLAGVLDEGEARGLPVTIHVESFNRALRLYERLGFRPIAEHGAYYLLEWKPAHACRDG